MRRDQFLLLAAGVLLGGCSEPPPSATRWSPGWRRALHTARQRHRPVLVAFFTDW